MKKQLLAGVLLLTIGFFVGLNQKPTKIEESEIITKQLSEINKLKEDVKTLETLQKEENVKTITIEKKDGTKVTTRIRQTKTNRNISSSKKKSSLSQKSENTEIIRKKITTYSKNNSIGVKSYYELFKKIRTKVYLKAGIDCFILNCYVEGAYILKENNTQLALGLEYRF